MFYWKFNSKREKSASWYTIAIILAIALIVWWYIVWLNIMSVIVILVIWVYLLVENNSPDIVDVGIDENWITISSSFYDYPKIETFSIVYSTNPALLRLKLKSKWFRHIDLPIQGDVNYADLRSFLSTYLQEDDKGELTSLEKLAHYLKI
jgi:hypothetical protein